jgi:hypothetical protein
MKQPSLLIRWFAPILFALTLSGFAAAENPATEENKAKNLDQKIDEWFGKATGPFVNAVFYPLATDIDVEKVSKMPENLTLAAPAGVAARQCR